MSDLTASVRVIPDEPGQGRPNAARMHEAAERLRKLGFTVVRIGRFGVSVAGSEREFERILGCNPTIGSSASRSVSLEDPLLQRLVDAVEVAPPPKLLAASLGTRAQ